MKHRYLAMVMAVASSSVVYAGFTPVPLDPSSFTADVVVEKEATPSLAQRTTATVDGGTNNNANTWYEVGFNTAAPTTGLPAAGSVFTHQTFPTRSYQMAPSYTAPNAILIDTVVTNAMWTLSTPAAYGALSIVASSGNGGGNITTVVLHQDGTSQTNVFNPGDWFGRDNPAWTANGRLNANNFAPANVDSNNPRLNSSEFALNNTTSPVVSISFYYGSGNANVHNALWAVSGAPTIGGTYTPIAVTGYAYDMVVEAGSPMQQQVIDTEGLPATTQTMDSDANTSNTWYERGYNQNNPTTAGTNAAFSGLPAPGSTIVSTSGVYTFQMPASYKGNNALYFNATLTPTATITPVTPVAATVLSFLGGTGGGQANLAYVVNHQDGSTQTGTLPILDWFNSSTPVFMARGRVSPNTGVFDAVNSVNPRLFASDIVLANTTSPVTSIDLTYSGTTQRPAIFAMSASTGDELPSFLVQPADVKGTVPGNASFGAVAVGTGTLTYQWQKGTNGVFVNLINGGKIAGVTTTNLVVTGFTTDDDADYRCVASNGAGSVNSSTVHLTALSTLLDVTAPGDLIVVDGVGVDNPPNEGIANAINDTTSKWLHRDGNNAAPFVGPVGFRVTPEMGRTIVTGLRFFTANDDANRDPSDFVLEGSNDGGLTYTLIASNALSFPGGRNAGGLGLDPATQNIQQKLFPNTAGYTTYRLRFNNVRNNGATGLLQIGDIEFLGVIDNSIGLPVVAAPVTMVNAIVNTPSSLSGTASGNPAPTVSWIRKGSGGDVVVTDGAGITGATTTTLNFDSAAFADTGIYALVANNVAGSVTSAPISFTVFSDKADISGGATVTSFGGASDTGLEGSFAFDDTFAPHQNRGSSENAGAGFPPFGGPVGLVVTPTESTIVSGIRFYASDSNSERDPLDYKLEGSNDGGATYTEISTGAVAAALPVTRNLVANIVSPVNGDGSANSAVEFLFPNGVSYTSYRLTFSDIRIGGDVQGSGSSLRVGEIELLGVVGTATPTTVTISKVDGGQLRLQWSSGSLLEAPTVTGPWTTNSAASPFTVNPTEAQKFYQIRTQ